MISLVLLVQCVEALPNKALTAEKLALPQGQRVVRWLTRLSGASDSEASAQLIAWSERGIAARRWALAPTAAVFRSAGLRQQWNLFLTVSDEAFRMRIDVQALRDKSWRSVYLAHELDELGLEPLLSLRRLRSIYNPNKYGVSPKYAAWTGWLAQRILHEHPELGALRVSMERLAIGDPHGAARLLDTRYVFEHARAGSP